MLCMILCYVWFLVLLFAFVGYRYYVFIFVFEAPFLRKQSLYRNSKSSLLLRIQSIVKIFKFNFVCSTVLTYNRNTFFVLAFVVAIYRRYTEFLTWLVAGCSRVSVLSLICSYTFVSAKKAAKQHNKLTTRMLMYLCITILLCMVTRQRPAWFRVRTRAGQERFGQNVVPAQASVQCVTGGGSGSCVRLTTYLHLAPRLGKSRALSPIPHIPSCRVSANLNLNFSVFNNSFMILVKINIKPTT